MGRQGRTTFLATAALVIATAAGASLADARGADVAGTPVGEPEAREASARGADDQLMMTPDELEWGPVASMGEGAQIAFIEGDVSQAEPFTFRLRLDDGYEILPHVHPEYERVTVLSGTLHFAHGETFDRGETRALPVGSVAIMPPGEPMFGYAEGEVVIQLHGTGPWGIEYLNPEDDPRNAN